MQEGKTLSKVALVVSCLALLLAAVSLQKSQLQQSSSNNPSIRVVEVKLLLAQLTTIEEKSEYVASLQSRHSVTLQPETEGRVTQVFVKPGTRVAAGTKMLQVNDFKIPAPIAGVVDDILVNQGDYVNTSTKLTTVTQNQPLEVNVKLPTALIPRLHEGMLVELRDGQALSFGTAPVFFISPNVDNTGTVLVKSLFDNSKNQLRNGQNVIAKIVWRKRPGILIPTTAVSRLGGLDSVYVVQMQGQFQFVARRKHVKLGDIQGDRYPILEGLQPGEKVIVSDVLDLRDGQLITPKS